MEGHIKLASFVKRRLNLKILIALFLGVSVIIGFLISFSVTSEKKELKRKTVNHGEQLKYLIYAGIKHPMSIGDSSTIEKHLLDIRREVKNVDIVISNFDGKITFATEKKLLSSNVSAFIHNQDARTSVQSLLKTGDRRYEKTFEEALDNKRYLLSIYGIQNAQECHQCHAASRKILGSLVVRQSIDDTYAALSSLQQRALLAGIIGITALIATLYFILSRLVTEPSREFAHMAEKLASGDLSVKLDVKKDDELASIGNAINKLAFYLKDVVSKLTDITESVSNVTANISDSSQGVISIADIQKKAIDATASATEEMDRSILNVAKSAESLADSAGETSSAIIEMKASIEKVADNSSIFSETSHDTASSIEEMVSNIRQIADSLETLSTSSTEIASSIEEVSATTKDIEQRAQESVTLAETVMKNASDNGMNASTAAMKGMETIKKSVETLSKVINLLGKKSDDIGKILNVIDDVADKTNLLALNAAILASKAGEHGRGFSVVANEIKDLAERTSASTSDIASLITSVQQETKSSIRMASDGLHTVESGLKLVNDLNGVLGEIVASSRESTEMARAIQRASTAEALVIKQIKDSIESMSEQTGKISRAIQEQSRGSNFILEAAERVNDLSQHVKGATAEQKDASKKIAQAIENVAQQASQIAAFTKDQKEKSREVVQSMDKIRETTDTLVSSSNTMNETVNALKQEALHLITEVRKFRV